MRALRGIGMQSDAVRGASSIKLVLAFNNPHVLVLRFCNRDVCNPGGLFIIATFCQQLDDLFSNVAFQAFQKQAFQKQAFKKLEWLGDFV